MLYAFASLKCPTEFQHGAQKSITGEDYVLMYGKLEKKN